MVNTGKFIVIEGLEGSGKSTIIDHVKNFLLQKDIEVLLVREPGGTTIGDTIRTWIKDKDASIPLHAHAELLLFYASRIELVEYVIKPSLSKGIWILADRFEWSTFAYQGGGRQLDQNFIQKLSKFSLNNFMPDWTIFLDVSVEKSLMRTFTRGELDRMEEEPVDFFHRVHDAYQKLLIHENDTVFRVNAEEQLLDVIKEVQHIVDNIVK